MFDLKNKVALVTGGKQGMGRAHAIALAGQGAKVVVTDRTGDAACIKMDVTNKAEIDSVFDEVIKKYGRLDILVNNAGVYNPKPALEITEEDWDTLIDINLKGQFLCAQRAAKEMVKTGGGRIINIASIASGANGIGLDGGVHYTASKGGVIGMTEALSIEWAPFSILVNAIAPGAIDTLMSRKVRLTEAEMKEFLEQRVPLKRIGKPEEVSAVVVFLASDEASYITGSTFTVDGGWLAA